MMVRAGLEEILPSTCRRWVLTMSTAVHSCLPTRAPSLPAGMNWYAQGRSQFSFSLSVDSAAFKVGARCSSRVLGAAEALQHRARALTPLRCAHLALPACSGCLATAASTWKCRWARPASAPRRCGRRSWTPAARAAYLARCGGWRGRSGLNCSVQLVSSAHAMVCPLFLPLPASLPADKVHPQVSAGLHRQHPQHGDHVRREAAARHHGLQLGGGRHVSCCLCRCQRMPRRQPIGSTGTRHFSGFFK